MMSMRQPRFRRLAVLKWTGVSLCSLIFVVWFGSRWFGATIEHRRIWTVRSAYVADGRLELTRSIYPYSTVFFYPEGWSFRRFALQTDGFHWLWSPERILKTVPTTLQGLVVPLYIPFTLLAAPTALLFCRDRRRVRWARSGCCAGCGYNLAGLPVAERVRCPECGRDSA